MKTVIDNIHENALRHSKRAARLFRESLKLHKETLAGPGPRTEMIAKAVELNRMAIEESKRSIRTMEFLRRYKH